MIIVYLKGGLGNQMFQYAAGRALAIMKNKKLLLDRGFYLNSPDRPYELNVFDVQEDFLDLPSNSLIRLCLNNELWPVRGLTKRLIAKCGVSTVVDSEFGFDPRIKERKGILYLIGYWQTEKYFDFIADIIRDDFGFRKQPDPINMEIINHIKACESVCIHVRRGDYFASAENRAIYDCCGLDYYARAIEKLKERLENPYWFVFSDDPHWVRNNLVCCEPKTVIMHNQNLQNFEDLRLMTYCKHFIIANSSFSWWGAWLADYSSKIVIAPKIWYADDQFRSPDIVPESWIRL